MNLPTPNNNSTLNDSGLRPQDSVPFIDWKEREMFLGFRRDLFPNQRAQSKSDSFSEERRQVGQSKSSPHPPPTTNKLDCTRTLGRVAELPPPATHSSGRPNLRPIASSSQKTPKLLRRTTKCRTIFSIRPKKWATYRSKATYLTSYSQTLKIETRLQNSLRCHDRDLCQKPSRWISWKGK